jgi:hypothetical protein
MTALLRASTYLLNKVNIFDYELGGLACHYDHIVKGIHNGTRDYGKQRKEFYYGYLHAQTDYFCNTADTAIELGKKLLEKRNGVTP